VLAASWPAFFILLKPTPPQVWGERNKLAWDVGNVRNVGTDANPGGAFVMSQTTSSLGFDFFGKVFNFVKKLF
jgi:hypothetical protein